MAPGSRFSSLSLGYNTDGAFAKKSRVSGSHRAAFLHFQRLVSKKLRLPSLEPRFRRRIRRHKFRSVVVTNTPLAERLEFPTPDFALMVFPSAAPGDEFHDLSEASESKACSDAAPQPCQ